MKNKKLMHSSNSCKRERGCTYKLADCNEIQAFYWGKLQQMFPDVSMVKTANINNAYTRRRYDRKEVDA